MDTQTATKPCSKCGEVKTLDGFYRRSTSADGYHGTCKVCHETRRRAMAPNPPAREGMKRCPTCDEEKHVDAFGRSSQCADGRYTYCRACEAARYRRTRQSPAAAAREARKSSARW